MKGRKLTLDEIRNLEDGTKVWVEELDEDYLDLSAIHIVNKEQGTLDSYDGTFYRLDLTPNSYCYSAIEFYEWLEEINLVTHCSRLYCSNCYKLVTEICRLRGLEVTDENVDNIIKEMEDNSNV